MGHDIVNFYKARFKIVIRGGLDDGGLNKSTSVDVSRPVDQTGGGPVGAVGFVTLVDKNSIVTIGTTYGGTGVSPRIEGTAWVAGHGGD